MISRRHGSCWCLFERRQRSDRARAALVPVLPTLLVRCCLLRAPGNSVASNESASATARGTPLRPRFGLYRLQGGFRVETEGHSASGGGSEAVRFGMDVWNAGAFFRMTLCQPPTSKTARTGDSASEKDEVIWRGRQF